MVTARSDVRDSNAQKPTQPTHAYLSFLYGITGVTGEPEDFCGAEASRNAASDARATGFAGKVADFLEFFASLDPAKPFGDVPLRNYAQFVADARAFLASGFAEKAMALGWTTAELFGCDHDRPFARIDREGLVWLLAGRRLIAVTADIAVIETWNGSRLTYRRKRKHDAHHGSAHIAPGHPDRIWKKRRRSRSPLDQH